jgi:uncharacterized protein YfaS (alpha-2-macroglobulin family)
MNATIGSGLRGVLMVWVMGVTCVASAANAAAQGSISPADVQQAIDSLVQYFRLNQNRQPKDGPIGAWQGHGDYNTGLTSLVVLALLSAGRKPADPEVARAL